MADEYKLWKVTIRYDAHHIDGVSNNKSSYQIVGADIMEALQKARELFSAKEWKGEELVRDGKYECKGVTLDNYIEEIKELQSHTPFPRLSGSDAGLFNLEPRLTENGRNIEYVVKEK